jgi:hypothetical protein
MSLYIGCRYAQFWFLNNTPTTLLYRRSLLSPYSPVKNINAFIRSASIPHFGSCLRRDHGRNQHDVHTPSDRRRPLWWIRFLPLRIVDGGSGHFRLALRRVNHLALSADVQNEDVVHDPLPDWWML